MNLPPRLWCFWFKAGKAFAYRKFRLFLGPLTAVIIPLPTDLLLLFPGRQTLARLVPGVRSMYCRADIGDEIVAALPSRGSRLPAHLGNSSHCILGQFLRVHISIKLLQFILKATLFSVDNFSLGSAAFGLDRCARQVQTPHVGKITKNYVYATDLDNHSQMVCAFGVTQPLELLA